MHGKLSRPNAWNAASAGSAGRPDDPGHIEDTGDIGGIESPDAFVVVVADPQTGELDCYGPYRDRGGAERHAHRLRRDCDLADLLDVIVVISGCHTPPARGASPHPHLRALATDPRTRETH